jgi:hypothetical protein
MPTTFWAPWPGTETVMFCAPCCWTWALLKPAPLTRSFMMSIAWVIAPWLGTA